MAFGSGWASQAVNYVVENPYILFVGFLLYVFIFALSVLFSSPKPGPNPFQSDAAQPLRPIILDHKERDKVLKQGFAQKRIPDKIDVIVIGSGIGGLTVANLLAKVGKRVLVLEQHDQAGGCLHTFVEKGFEFDVGIHYIGEMRNNTQLRHLIDQLTEGQLQWCDMDDAQDIVALGDPLKPRKYPIMSGREVWRTTMKKNFPDDHAAIDRFLELLQEVRKNVLGMVSLKMMPSWLGKLVCKTGAVHFMTKYFRYSSKSVKQVLDELTDNQDLKAVLAYSFGDYGTEPSEGSFAMHALLLNHYLYGSSYPRGGASEIAINMIPAIERAGGRVLVRAPVSRILTNEKGRAVGVRVSKTTGDVDIFAKKIVSAAGLFNTVKMLPKEIACKMSSSHLLEKKVKSGMGAMNLFVGLNGTKEELGLKAQNMWAFTDNDLSKVTKEYLNMTVEQAMETDIPLLFISFPSAKDPTFSEKYPGKSVCTVVTLANWNWFSKWENERVMKRGDDYEKIKHAIGERMWQQVLAYYPQLKDKVEYFEVGSPVTNKYYIAAPKGEIYGLDHTTARFGSPDVVSKLRPDTEIPGLYLSGQDTFSCGFAGAMMSGMLTASTLLHRNLHADLVKLKQKVGNKWANQKKTN